MTEHYRPRVRYVIGPDGSPADRRRSPAARYQALGDPPQGRGGGCCSRRLISLEEACERYTLTVDEFLSWQRSIDKHGLPGLRATRIQDYRGS